MIPMEARFAPAHSFGVHGTWPHCTGLVVRPSIVAESTAEQTLSLHGSGKQKRGRDQGPHMTFKGTPGTSFLLLCLIS